MILTCGVIAAINTEGQKGLVRTLTAKTFGRATMNVGIGLNYATDNSYGQELYVNGVKTNESFSARLLTPTINMGIGIASFFDVAASLPIFYDKAGHSSLDVDGGIGDLSLSVKLLYPPPGKPRVFHQAYLIGGTIPTGGKDNGIFPRYNYYEYRAGKDSPGLGRFYTADCFVLKPMMLWTFDIGSVVKEFQFEIDVNLGGAFSVSSDPGRNNMVLLNIAIQYAPAEFIDIFVDFAGQSRWQNFESGFKLGTDPLMLSPGVILNTPVGMFVLMSADFALLAHEFKEYWAPDHDNKNEYATYVAPKFGVQFAVGWTGYLTRQDTDKDGIKDDLDRCPKDPEDKDGYEDSDGCPDKDNDKDGIPDETDKCPNKAEDRDGFEDSDGCPDLDNDKDGIPDLTDKCPLEAEDFDGIDDKDGCPDGDNDNDGIQDKDDKCINEPEDVDNFQDEDGCPDPDNDKDGIPDLKDKCPNEPETLNGFEDEDGCPDKKPEKKVIKKQSVMPKHQILEGVNFASGKTNITFSSYQYLDPIVREMQEYPEIEIEIRGHTDSVGKYESNMRLSNKRAESVKMYIIKKGIESRRVRSVGFGPSSPVADNRTAAGRSKNRRIEVVRIR